MRLDPQTVDLTFRSNPAGLELVVGQHAAAAPFTRTVIVGSANSVSAVSPQTLGGNGYTFSSWSDGGAATHTSSRPATPDDVHGELHGRRRRPSGWWPPTASKPSGTAVTDSSGTGNNGTTPNATWTAAGRFGSALTFDGVNAWVTVADAPSST